MLRDARVALQRIVDETPWDIDYRILRAQAEILGARWALREGEPEGALLDDAAKPLSGATDRERARPQLYQTLAEIHELRAAFRASRREGAGDEIAKGLAMAEKALAWNPHMATALAVKGALLLLDARTARDLDAAQAAARRAREALSAARRENPLIVRDRGPLFEEATRLVGAHAAR